MLRQRRPPPQPAVPLQPPSRPQPLCSRCRRAPALRRQPVRTLRLQPLPLQLKVPLQLLARQRRLPPPGSPRRAVPLAQVKPPPARWRWWRAAVPLLLLRSPPPRRELRLPLSVLLARQSKPRQAPAPSTLWPASRSPSTRPRRRPARWPAAREPPMQPVRLQPTPVRARFWRSTALPPRRAKPQRRWPPLRAPMAPPPLPAKLPRRGPRSSASAAQMARRRLQRRRWLRSSLRRAQRTQLGRR